MEPIHKYGLLIFRNNSFLINRKESVSTFLMPGGKPEGEETPEQCLKREIKEEHGCGVSNLEFFEEFEDLAADNSRRTVIISCYTGDLKGEPIPSNEIVEQRWFSKEDDPKILSPIIKNKILPKLLEKGLL